MFQSKWLITGAAFALDCVLGGWTNSVPDLTVAHEQQAVIRSGSDKLPGSIV